MEKITNCFVCVIAFQICDRTSNLDHACFTNGRWLTRSDTGERYTYIFSNTQTIYNLVSRALRGGQAGYSTRGRGGGEGRVQHPGRGPCSFLLLCVACRQQCQLIAHDSTSTWVVTPCDAVSALQLPPLRCSNLSNPATADNTTADVCLLHNNVTSQLQRQLPAAL